jgi:hypothetical protein
MIELILAFVGVVSVPLSILAWPAVLRSARGPVRAGGDRRLPLERLIDGLVRDAV